MITDEKPPELTGEQKRILRRMVLAAGYVRNNGQLRRILRKIEAKHREAFFELLKPHLRFKVWSYSALKS